MMFASPARNANILSGREWLTFIISLRKIATVLIENTVSTDMPAFRLRFRHRLARCRLTRGQPASERDMGNDRK
jgi:hypothetical protein